MEKKLLQTNVEYIGFNDRKKRKIDRQIKRQICRYIERQMDGKINRKIDLKIYIYVD